MFRSWVLCVMVGTGSVAQAATIRVPEDRATIQAAIDQASDTQVDTILVGPGTYFERPRIVLKSVVLRGASGAENTVLDGGRGGNVLTVAHVGRSCVIEDLTITGGGQTDPSTVGAGIYVERAYPVIQRCWLVDNHARVGGGVATWDSEPLIRECWIAYNLGGGIFMELGVGDLGSSWIRIVDTVIVRNVGWAVYALRGARARVENCTIAYNGGDGVRARAESIVDVRRSIITHNGGFGIARVQSDPTVCFSLFCNNVFDNQNGNWSEQFAPSDPSGCAAQRGTGSVFIQPCYRNPQLDDFHLQPTSPLCILREPDACGAIGAYRDDPCSDRVSDCTVTVRQSTWAQIKKLYGEPEARRP